MTTFRDSTKEEWSIELPIGLVIQVKKESGGKFNLLDQQHPMEVDGPFLDKMGEAEQRQQFWVLHSDFHLEEFFELLWYLVRQQASEKEVTAEQFGARMAGKCLIQARAAFFEEWQDFFRQLQQPEKAMMLEKMTHYMATKVEAAEKYTAETRRKLKDFETRMPQKFDQILSSSSDDLLASLESIFDDTPGES